MLEELRAPSLCQWSLRAAQCSHAQRSHGVKDDAASGLSSTGATSRSDELWHLPGVCPTMDRVMLTPQWHHPSRRSLSH